jgi:hypothetical protein
MNGTLDDSRPPVAFAGFQISSYVLQTLWAAGLSQASRDRLFTAAEII